MVLEFKNLYLSQSELVKSGPLHKFEEISTDYLSFFTNLVSNYLL